MRSADQIKRLVVALRHNRAGATLVEFAIVSPVMVLLMMGLGDLLYQGYAQAILSGAVQKAARDSGIQGGGDPAAMAATDAKVTAAVTQVAKSATFTFVRKNYDTFTQVAPERFDDNNGNGVRDPGECFYDVNGNGTWDADPGLAGQGGASDVTAYVVTATYTRVFPVAGLFGWSNTATIQAQTLLKNQPWLSQSTTSTVKICT